VSEAKPLALFELIFELIFEGRTEKRAIGR
jgi:hypothetical protein